MIFKRFHKRRIDGLAEAAASYVGDHYKTVHFSKRLPLFSEDDDPILSGESTENGRGRREDKYDSRQIDLAMRGLSSSALSSDTVRTLEKSTDLSFVDKMLDYIAARKLRDADVYKAAQIDRRLFSKIVSDRAYKPSKDTCIALSLALRLSLSEADDILSRAGYSLSHSSKRDVVIEYFFRERVYDLNDVNAVLYRLEEKTLGR